MEEPNGNQIGSIESFYDAVASSLQGETPTIPTPNSRNEQWLAYIASLIQNGGTGGSDGIADSKVTTIDDSVTDKQYPSALAVKNYVDSAVNVAVTQYLEGNY